MTEADNPYALDALVAADEWKTLAAIVWNRSVSKADNRSAPTNAMAKLAAGTSKAAAFSELWTLLGFLDTSGVPDAVASELWVEAPEKAPELIFVPDALVGAVGAFVTTAEDDQRHRHDSMRIALLLRSNVRVTTRRKWARQLLNQNAEAPSPHELLKAAYQLLAEAANKQDREMLVDRAVREQQPPETVRLLRQIPVDKRDGRVHDAVATAVTSQPLASGRNSANSAVADILAELPDKVLADALNSDWANQSRQGLQAIGLGHQLSLDALRHLCSGERVPGWVREQLLADAHQRPASEVLTWGRWLYSQDEAATRNLVDHVVDNRLAQTDDELAAEKLREAVDVLATERNDLKLAGSLARLYETDQLLDVLSRTGPSDFQLGHVLAAACQQPQADTQVIADAIQEEGNSAEDLITGYFEKPPQEIPDEVARACFQLSGINVAAIRIILASQLRGEYIATLTDRPPDVAIAALSLTDVQYSEGELSHLAAATHWQRTPANQFASAVDLIGARSEQALIALAVEAIGSLDGPELRAVKMSHLAALLEATLERMLGPDLAESVPDGVQSLLQAHISRDVRQVVCRWIQGLRPTETLVRAVAAAHDHTVDLDKEFKVVREDQAGELLEHAQDASLDLEKRAVALKIAAEADVGMAREVALDLLVAGDAHINLQLAAVDTLRESGLRTDDIEKAEGARDAAAHRMVREALDVLLQRVTSGTHAEALSNLFEMLRLDYTAEVDVLLPVESLRDGFQSAADKVRRDESGPADTYITQVTSLADHLMEIALVTDNRTGGTLVKRAEADKIAENAPGKPKAGQLALHQDLQQKLHWVVHVASLHKRRIAHANRAGSTTPPSFGPEDATWATMALKEVVDGWVTSMHDMARRVEPGER